MTYTVILTEDKTGKSRSEIIQLEVSAKTKSGSLHRDTPWESFGAFKDDPTWGELFDEIQHHVAPIKAENSKCIYGIPQSKALFDVTAQNSAC